MSKQEIIVRKRTRKQPSVSPVGHFKFIIDQQVFSRFILFYRFSYYATFPRKWEKTIKNDRQSAILDFISANFIMDYPCVSPYILFYMHGPAILLWFWAA